MNNAELHLVESLDDANALARWLGERRRVLAVDTETGGLDWWREPLRLVQLGDADTGWAIPWEGWGGLVKDKLMAYDGELVMHNAKFDMHFLRANGVQLNGGQVHDTALLAGLSDPLGSKALKTVSVRYLGPGADVGQDLLQTAMRKQKWTWRTVPVDFEPYWAYGALDTVLTARVFALLHPEVQAKGMGPAYQVEREAALVLGNMEQRGCLIDRQYASDQITVLQNMAQKMFEEIYAEYGFEPTSNKQLGEALVAAGAQLPMTDKGNARVDEASLRACGHPIAEKVLRMRSAGKLAETYFGNFVDLADADDLLHPSIHPMGAKTGRMSVGRPSLQNLPRTRYLRWTFQARPGNQLVMCDFDQIEMRLMAHYSQDPALIQAFSSGMDFFTFLARQVYSDDTLEKKDPRRQVTKSAAYAKAYGAGVSTFARTAGITPREAKAFLARFDAAFPAVAKFQRQVDAVGTQRAREEGEPYIVTHAGRRAVAENEQLVYKLVNFLLQGTAADILKQKLVDLDRAGMGRYLILPVHDEVLLDVPRDEVDEVAREVQEIMTDPNWTVPLTAGVDIATRWGEKYDE